METPEQKLVRDALRFYAWAAGEGLSAIGLDPEPEDALFEYAHVTGDEDYDGYADKIAAMLPAPPAVAKE